MAAWEVLRDAALRLNNASVPDPTSVRFRVDGRGGEVASPFPMTARLDPALLADAAVPGDWFEEIFPSGDWIGLNLSERWRGEVRRRTPVPRAINVKCPPVPSFPARILPEDWRINVLLSSEDPYLAARLDAGNPARQIRLCQCRAEQNRGKNRPDRVLICQCALLLAALEEESAEGIATALERLSRMYLTHPGEDVTTARLVRAGLDCLLAA